MITQELYSHSLFHLFAIKNSKLKKKNTRTHRHACIAKNMTTLKFCIACRNGSCLMSNVFGETKRKKRNINSLFGAKHSTIQFIVFHIHTHGSSSFVQAKSKELRPFVAETEIEMEVIADEVHWYAALRQNSYDVNVVLINSYCCCCCCCWCYYSFAIRITCC